MGLKLEVGKYYKTRDGRKVGITGYNEWEERFPYDADNGHTYTANGTVWSDNPVCSDLIAEWTDAPTGPVRTVTRKEIVPGKFGLVRVIEGHPDGMHVDLVRSLTLTDDTELRAAIATLTEIADALEEQ